MSINMIVTQELQKKALHLMLIQSNTPREQKMYLVTLSGMETVLTPSMNLQMLTNESVSGTFNSAGDPTVVGGIVESSGQVVITNNSGMPFSYNGIIYRQYTIVVDYNIYGAYAILPPGTLAPGATFTKNVTFRIKSYYDVTP